MIDSTVLNECRQLAFEVAPELRQNPLYVHDSRTFEYQPPGCVLGWALPGGARTDYGVRAAIGDAWEGPGNVIALCEDEIRSAMAIQDASAFRICLLSVFIHELGHLLPVQKIPRDDLADLFDTPDIRAHQLKQQIEADSLPVPHPDDANNEHGSAFVRRVVHLFARSLTAGWDNPTYNLFGADCFFVSQPAHYIQALLPELIAMQMATFSEIAVTPRPAAFAELWRGNVQFYESFQTQGNPNDTRRINRTRRRATDKTA